jgi:outer membrane protein TolC
MNNITKAIFFSLGALLARPVFSQEISVKEVIAKTIEKNPDLSAALAEKKRAALSVEIEENRLRTTIAAETKYSHSVNAFAGTSLDSMLLTSELSKQSSLGTRMSAAITLNNTLVSNESSTQGASLSLNITQPILQGFGQRINLASLRSAEFSMSSNEASYQSTVSAMLRDVLVAYWELWYSQQAVLIQEKALEVIKAQISEAEIKLSYGVVSPSALLSLQTEEASIEEQLANAKAAVRANSLALSVLLGETSPTLLAGDALPAIEKVAPLKDLIAAASQGSPDLRSLSASIDVAQVSLDLASDQKRPTLNAIGQFQLASNNNPLDTTGGEATGFLGLRLELPSAQNGVRAEEQRARLAVDAAQDRFDAAQARLAQQVSAQAESLSNGEYRLTLAEKTAKLAEATVAAEKARFDAGIGTAIELVRVQQQEREAKLRVVRIQVDQINDQLRLAHLTGQLVEKFL